MTSIFKIIISIASVVVCFHSSFAQSYSMKYIYLKTDTTLRESVGERISVEYHIRRYLINYQYKKRETGKIKEEKIKTYNWKSMTKGNFIGGETVYHFSFKDINDIGWKSFMSPAQSVHLDANLNPVTPVEISGIPEYILNNDTTKFITYEQAIAIIEESFIVNPSTKEIQQHYQKRKYVPYLELHPEPIIIYSAKLLFERNMVRHYWRVTQAVICGQISGYIESIEEDYMEKYGHLYDTKDLYREFYLDAITGDILHEGKFESGNLCSF